MRIHAHSNIFSKFSVSGDEFYFLHVIADNHPSSSLMAGLDGLGGVDSALIVDASSESGAEQVSKDPQSDQHIPPPCKLVAEITLDCVKSCKALLQRNFQS